MDIQEKVYCNLDNCQLKQLHRKMTGINIEIGKSLERMINEFIQEAFDEGRKFESKRLNNE